METKKLILLGVLGVIAAGGFITLQKMSAPAPTNKKTAEPVQQIVDTVEYVDILAATQDLPLGTKLTAEMLKWRKWPAKALEPNQIDNKNQPQALEEYVGAITKTPIYAGEPIMQQKVVQPGEKGVMSAVLSPGMRAISTRITTDSAAGGFIQPGDRVDVILTTQIVDTRRNFVQQGQQKTYISNTIFEDVPVLAIGQINQQAADGTAFVIGNTATLELSPSDAEVLIEAQSRGEISLVLRSLDRRRAGYVPSRATVKRDKKTGNVSSLTVYRGGEKQQVAIQGR